MNFRTLVLLIATLLAPAALCAEPAPIGADIFARADQVMNIRTGDTVPFKITIRFQVLNMAPQPVEGIFTRLYVSQEKWRSETVFGPYQRIEWGGVNGYWRERNTTAEPWAMRDIDRMIAYSYVLTQHKQIRWTGVKHTTTVDGKPVTAVEGLWGRVPWTYYFDDTTGVLVRLDFANGRGAYEWSDFQPFRSKLFPRTMKMFQAGKVIMLLHVDELVKLENPDSLLLVHSAGAEQRPNCVGMKFPVLTDETPSFVPPGLRDVVRQGRIPVLTAMIGKDGRAHDTAISRTSGNDALDAAAMEAVKGYKWQPAMCGNDPVEIEIEFCPKMVF